MTLHPLRRRSTVVIPFATGGLPLRVMSCLGPVGARFMLLSDEDELSARYSAYCSHFIHVERESDGEMLNRLLQLDTHDPEPILLPVTTKGFEFVAEHRDILSSRYNLPPLSALDSLQIASDKWRLYDLARRHGLPVLPSTLLTENVLANVVHGDPAVHFPVLLKPSRKENGIGIRKVESARELAELQKTHPELSYDESLVQRFVDGDDFSLSVYCENGEIKAHTLWRATVKSAIPYTIPVCIQFVENTQVLAIGARLLGLLRWQGVCDIDFLVDRRTGEVWILEVNARFWGNVLSCAKGGVNFPLLMLQAARRASPRAWPRQKTHAIFCFAKGAARGVRLPHVRRALLWHPLRSTGIEALIRDPAPELVRVRSLLGRIFRRFFRQDSEPAASP